LIQDVLSHSESAKKITQQYAERSKHIGSESLKE